MRGTIEVVDQILDGEPGPLPSGSPRGPKGTRIDAIAPSPAATSTRSGVTVWSASAVPSREPAQEPGQSLGLDLHRTSTAGKFPDPAHPGTLAQP